MAFPSPCLEICLHAAVTPHIDLGIGVIVLPIWPSAGWCRDLLCNIDKDVLRIVEPWVCRSLPLLKPGPVGRGHRCIRGLHVVQLGVLARQQEEWFCEPLALVVLFHASPDGLQYVSPHCLQVSWLDVDPHALLPCSLFCCHCLLGHCRGSKLGRLMGWCEVGQIIGVGDGLVSCRNEDLLEPDLEVLVTQTVVVHGIV